VILPDLSFVRADRVPPLDQQQGYPELVPDFVIEILTPSNTALETAERVRIYLEPGVLLVWLLNPRQRSITVHTPDHVARTCSRTTRSTAARCCRSSPSASANSSRRSRTIWPRAREDGDR
jgi:hypothetical protein